MITKTTPAGRSRNVPLDGEHAARLRALVESDGERAAMAFTGLSRMAILSALAGRPLTLGTRTVIHVRLPPRSSAAEVRNEG